ncbi:MAG: hypothetical protein EAZ44_02635 [Cytophagia bacterium]|nr:MAG: hypothetical protein EAZ44_02635 [Cytophagia bacterium]TAG44229.1 MAG: hypothetical protein EAZ31_02785 [Cytophagia bacterium]
MKLSFFIFSFLFFSFLLKAQTQIDGQILDEQKKPLPFVTIYIKNSNISVASNEKGNFSIIIPNDFKGEKILVFQYVGYKTHFENITTSKNIIITLKAEDYVLNEVVISSKKIENPADRIIKLAQEKRKYYLDEELNAWQCKVYQKNLTIAHKFPKKLLGQKIGVDTGIIGLTENINELSFLKNQYREKILASKSSGEPNKVTVSSIADVWVNLYKKISGFDFTERGFVSPIAPSSMLYYRFELLGETMENNQKIYKIKLIPRKKYSPAYNGVIYIADSSWRIVQTDLYIKKQALDVGNSLVIQQIYKPSSDNKGNTYYLPQTQRLWVKVNFLGIKVTDQLNAFYKEYTINPIFPTDFFSGEKKDITIDSLANKQDTTFWNQYRPFPLSLREIKDYQKKDSIANKKENPAYLDSVRIKNNRFSIGKLLIGGYNYEPKKRTSIRSSLPSLASGIGFNTVEGFLLEFNPTFRKYQGKKWRSFSLTPTLRYGFANKTLQAKIETSYELNNKKQTILKLEGGQYIEQISRKKSITTLLNTAYSLLDEQNFMKIYQKEYIKGSWQQNINKTFSFNTSLEWANRLEMKNNTDYTWRNVGDREYSSNTPIAFGETSTSFSPYKAMIWETNFDTKVSNFFLFNNFYINYRKGIKTSATNTDFDFIHAGFKGNYYWGMLGESEWNIEAGKFMNTKNIQFVDYQHFLGNQTLLLNDNLQSFQLLDYYNYSQNTEYLKGHFSHRFKGFLTNDLFFMRMIRAGLRVSGNYLYSPLTSHYLELGAGIDVFGAGVEYYHSWLDKNSTQNRGIRIRIPF